MLWLWLACSEKTTDSAITTECNPLTESFLLLPNSPSTQIHADVASDGEQVWMVYNLPNEENDFDVYLTAIACDGGITWGPEQIIDIPGLNQTTPRISIAQDRIFIAAQADSGSAGTNLSIHIHIRDTAGNIIDERVWSDDIVTGNAWLPSVASAGDGFWMAAANANSSYFRTAVQAFTLDGTPKAAAHWVGPDSYAIFPNIDAAGNNYIVGWETGDDNVQYTQGDIDGSSDDVQTIENHAGVRVLWDASSPTIFSYSNSPLKLYQNGIAISELSNSFYPNAAKGDSSTLFAYYRLQNGIQNDIYYGFERSNGESEVDILLRADPPAAPYRPAVTHLRDDIYFVAWSQGISPDFTLWGQFITVE